MDDLKKQEEMLKYNSRLQNRYRQSNSLVESPYSQEFSSHEIKIFEIAAASCVADDVSYVNLKNDKEFCLTNIELAKLLNSKPNVISMEIEKTAARIIKKTIYLRKILNDGSVEFQMINMIPYAEYKNGVFKFRLNYSIIPYLLEINKNFTEFQLHNILSMSSSYAIKLYKLLYQYKNIGKRKFTIENLKIQFGVIDKYKQYSDFKKYIIDSSITQINNKTDLEVKYNEIKFSRKVSDIEFVFNIKKNQFIIPKIIEGININLSIIKNNQELKSIILDIENKLSVATKAIIKEFYATKGGVYIQACINYTNAANPQNYDKYLKDTLIHNYAEVEFNKLTSLKQQQQIEINKQIQENERINNKKLIEHQQKQEIEKNWNLLDDQKKQIYLDFSESLINKHNKKLKIFENINNILPLCIYSISNGKSYNKSLELYIRNSLDVSLNISEL